jgi:Tol biopolymer transport system component
MATPRELPQTHRTAGFGIGVGGVVIVMVAVLGLVWTSGAARSNASLSLARPDRLPGMRLLYTSDWSGSREIYTVDPGHPSEMAQVTFGHEPSCTPLVVACGFSNVVPSPDGRHVAFTSFADYKTSSLYVSRIDGRARRRVARLDGCSGDIAWAPDSRKFAYVSNCASPRVYIAHADGSGSRRVGYGQNPLWSPDGRSLALLANRDLWIVTNGRFHRIATDVDSYAWSETGKVLAIGTYGKEDPYYREFLRVATIRPDGTHRHVLNNRPVYSFTWSPSGRLIGLDVDTTGEGGELDVVRADGSQQRLFSDRFGFVGWTWSSDDRYVSYSGYTGLTVLDLAHATTTQLGPDRANQWSRRGHLLAFSTGSATAIFDPTTGSTRRLSSDSTGWIEWAPDDRFIAYVSATPYLLDNGDLKLAMLDGRVRTLVSASGTAGGAFASLTWIRSVRRAHYRRPEPRKVAVVSADALTARWSIQRIAADGDRVLYVSCNHLFVWTPKTGDVAQVEAASLTPQCSTPGHYLPVNVYDVALAGDRVAFGVQSGNMSQTWELFDEPLAHPAAQQEVAKDFGYAGCTLGNAGLGDLVGAGDLLVFSRWHEPIPDSRATCGTLTAQQIYRLDPLGCPCPQVATSPGPLLPSDVNGGRVIAIGSNATEVLDRNGALLSSVAVHALSAQLAGSDLIVVVPGQLRDYDAVTGALRHTWPLADVPTGGPCGSPHPEGCPSIRLELEDVARGLAAYVFDGELHVVELENGTDTAIAKATTARFMSAGLVYASGDDLRLVPFGQLN